MKNTISQEQINDTAVSLGIPTIPFFQRRIARAYDLVETNKVNEISHDDGLYRVHSQYDDKIYTVEVNHGNPSCSCPDGAKTVFCKHMIASMMIAFEQKANSKLILYINPINNKRNQWAVDEGDDYYIVRRPQHGKWTCTCGKPNCKHCKAIRENLPKPKIESECGSTEAKALQDKLNGNNGTGDIKSPSHNLDVSNPFQECEMLDIDQIEGRSNGDLVHVLSNGEYVVSYYGIMNLANKHGVTFDRHTDEQEAKEKRGAIRPEGRKPSAPRTVIAYGRCGGNSRASGKPANGNFTTAVELAKRNAARQLLPLPEIKALEHKAKLEAEFDWQVAKRKCLGIVPDFTFDILIHDLVKAGTLRQAHPSDYSRKEWLLIFDACKRDAETNGNDADGGDDTPSSDEQVSCAICSRTLTNPESVRLQVGPICREKIGIKGEAHLHGNIISDELIQASQLYQDEVLQKRILRACLTLDAPPPVKVLNWLGNEYFGYRNRPILYYFCAAGQLNRIDTSNRKLRHIIVTRDTAETELDAHALAQMAVDSEPDAEVPITESEFVERCKQAEATVDDLTDDNSEKPLRRFTAFIVDESATAPMVEGAQMDGDGKRKLVMDKNKNITLVEPDGTETPITMRDAAFTYGSNYILRLTQGIACGGDISTVELD